jgi:hypothetical protein
MLSKKIVLSISGFISLLLLISNSFGNSRLCSVFSWNRCLDVIFHIELYLVPFLAIFVMMLFLYFLRVEVYKIWIWFTVLWIVISEILIYLAPDYGNEGFLSISLTKNLVVFYTFWTFFAVSLLLSIATYLYFWLKKKPSVSGTQGTTRRN